MPAVTGVPADQARSAALAPFQETLPGLNRAILAPVTPEESEQAIESRPVPEDLNRPEADDGLGASALRIGATPPPPARPPSPNWPGPCATIRT